MTVEMTQVDKNSTKKSRAWRALRTGGTSLAGGLAHYESHV